MTSFEDLQTRVRDSGGIITVQAWELREAAEAGRLTPRINATISTKLRGVGLGHVPATPEEMPTSQHQEVRLYDNTTHLAKVIEAALAVDEGSNQVLRELGDGGAADILEKIRVLVADD